MRKVNFDKNHQNYIFYPDSFCDLMFWLFWDQWAQLPLHGETGTDGLNAFECVHMILILSSQKYCKPSSDKTIAAQTKQVCFKTTVASKFFSKSCNSNFYLPDRNPNVTDIHINRGCGTKGLNENFCAKVESPQKRLKCFECETDMCNNSIRFESSFVVLMASFVTFCATQLK